MSALTQCCATARLVALVY